MKILRNHHHKVIKGDLRGDIKAEFLFHLKHPLFHEEHPPETIPHLNLLKGGADIAEDNCGEKHAKDRDNYDDSVPAVFLGFDLSFLAHYGNFSSFKSELMIEILGDSFKKSQQEIIFNNRHTRIPESNTREQSTDFTDFHR
jgi:hypothetical protein